MKKFLSKLLSVFLVVLFVFSFSACSYEISPSKSDDFAIVNEAYTNLNSAYSEINTAMSIVSSSWGFSVTCGTKFNASGWSGSSYSYVDTAYANSIGVDYGDANLLFITGFFLCSHTHKHPQNKGVSTVSYIQLENLSCTQLDANN